LFQPVTFLMPAGTIADQDGVGTWRHLRADLSEMVACWRWA
jgi:hypothetical protein